MEKRNYLTQELDLLDRLERFFEAKNGSKLEKKAKRVDEQATSGQLALLAKLGIRPKWQLTETEAAEMICHYRTVLGRNRLP